MRRVCAAALAVLIASAVLTAGGCAVGEGFDGLPDGSTADEAGVSIHMAITNALKGGVDQTQTSLGLARFKTQADILGVDLLLDLGDLYYGNPFATMTGGESLADVIREVGYDAMLCGWSDWGYGVEKLRALERRSMVPVLASNVVSAETGEAFFGTPFIIRDIDGVRVGIFGVIDQALNRWTSKAVYEQVRFRDPVLAAQRAVSELAERGCQVIICMSSVSCAELIARSVPGLDAVLAGGEDWTGLDYGEDDVLRDVPIITAQTGLEDFASLELTMDPERLHVERVETRWYSAADYADIVPDPAVDSAIASRMTVLTPLFGEILNVTPVTLRAMDPMDPYAEAELPRLVTDAYREKTGADAAFTFAAATLKDIPAGSITYGQLIELGNPNNELLTLIVPGYMILDMLETSVDAMVHAGEAERITLEEAGLALERIYASGLMYMYDAQGVKGERVLDVRIGGRQLESDGMYTIAVSEGMRGLSSYMALNDAEVTGDFGKCVDTIREYIMEFGVEGAVEAEARAVRIE